MTAIERAKILLRQPKNETMTGYTPDGKSYFVSAGAWYKTPEPGDIIYFYSMDKGRVGHVGIVEKVNKNSKIVYTIEGNTRSGEYAENGGCVARHSYDYSRQGGTNRVNGFGRPNFLGAGVTTNQFLEVARGELGYMEKRNASQLDSKTANVGYNNFQKYQRDIGAGNGDQWCQYFVDGCALYTCQKSEKKEEKTYNETVQWNGIVDVENMAVRVGPSKNQKKCSFSDIPRGEVVGVCDSVVNKYGKKWFYIVYKGKHGFCYSKSVKKKTGKKSASDITVSEFLKSCKNVMDTARKNNFVYGDSRSEIPCSDGKISCDRLISRALYDLGFTDQRTGGEVCSTLDMYLKNHGFKRSTSPKDIKKGSILLVKHAGLSYISHAFVVVKFYSPNWNSARYDAGSSERIRTVQPLRHVKWGYTKNIIVYNI